MRILSASGLAAALLLCGASSSRIYAARPPSEETVAFPEHANIVNVKKTLGKGGASTVPYSGYTKHS